MQGRAATVLSGVLSGSLVLLCACSSDAADVASKEDGGAAHSGERSAADSSAASSRPDAGRHPSAAENGGCDLSGAWVTQHVTPNQAIGATQLATNWNYHVIEQHGAQLKIVDSLDCGYVVRGTTDVALGDAALEAMATMATNAIGVTGTLEVSEDGKGCELALDRIYTIRGANRAKFLDALWQVGDPPLDLASFTLPAGEADGMEDWDNDGHEGTTQLTGFGDRYTAQVDWHALHGSLPLADGALGEQAVLGGDGVLSADYDMRESVSKQTDLLLQASSVPMSPGYAQLVNAAELEPVTSGDHPELETCKRVQALAVQALGDPPSP